MFDRRWRPDREMPSVSASVANSWRHKCRVSRPPAGPWISSSPAAINISEAALSPSSPLPPLLSYSRPHIKSSSIPPRISPSKQGHTHLAARPKSFTRSNPQPHKQVSQGHTIFGREDLNCQSKPTATAPFAVSHARAGRFRPSSANLFFLSPAFAAVMIPQKGRNST